MSLRIYADFNSVDGGGWCWCLRYDRKPLGEVAEELDLKEGQAVVVYYEDPSEEFEFDAVLSFRNEMWQANYDQSTYRLVRSTDV
jgi:hypothetical protein